MITSPLPTFERRPRAAYPDGDVLELVRGGDVTAALRRVMQRHGACVYRYCRQVLRDPMLAEDVHQQVFLDVFRDLPRFRGRSTVRTWLFAIAHHRVLDAARARRRLQAHIAEADVGDAPDPRPSPGESIDDLRLRAALGAALGELDEHVRTAVLLHYQQGFTFEEMAEICHEKAGTLHARVMRAMPLLRAGIEARIGGSPFMNEVTAARDETTVDLRGRRAPRTAARRTATARSSCSRHDHAGAQT
jgi:RNA polymerase sigma-70 factor (ECF subfamily)